MGAGGSRLGHARQKITLGDSNASSSRSGITSSSPQRQAAVAVNLLKYLKYVCIELFIGLGCMMQMKTFPRGRSSTQ